MITKCAIGCTLFFWLPLVLTIRLNPVAISCKPEINLGIRRWL